MTANDILKDLKDKKYKPVYFLDGAEPYFIDQVTNYIAKNVLLDHEKEFNQTICYGQDVSPEEIIPIVKRFPMMAEKQVVIVKEAQNWRDIAKLEPIIDNPVESTILVINYKGKKLDGRSKILKGIKKNGVYLNSEPIKDTKVNSWISSYCSAKKMRIDSGAIAILGENIGADLANLVNALDKLQILCPEGETISPELVAKNIGISRDFNEFELQKALGSRNDRKALMIANYFANNQKNHHLIRVIVSLYYFYSKVIKYHSVPNPADNQTVARTIGINPYFADQYRMAAKNHSLSSLESAIKVLYDMDLKSKGVGNANAKSNELMIEMVSKLLRV